MSILAKNLKTIRKELGCTQSMMSGILKVGFRTFVRYEAGERDAPVSVLIKVARLANISLEKLLTTSIEPIDIVPLKKTGQGSNPGKIESLDFQTGYVTFKNPNCREIITVDDVERRILALFRKMPSGLKKDCIDSLEQIVVTGRVVSRLSEKAGIRRKGNRKVSPKVRIKTEPLQKSKTTRPLTRKELDKKVLQEKIDKLKLVTQTINKITVR